MSEERKRVRAAVMTMSDLGARGEREDTSGDRIVEFVAALGADLVERVIIPDEREQIRQNLMRFADDMELDLVLTTGGTGIAPRDRTFEAVTGLLDKRLDGFGELFRVLSYRAIGPAAMLSRAVAGTYRGMVLISMPGSTAAK